MKRVFLFCVVVFLSACAHPHADLPKYTQVPNFAMTSADGRTFHGSELAGKVWIADFIYTTCPAECPMMTARMKKVSEQVNSEVALVSFTVDPEHDTPAALKEFASHYGAPTAQWTFLTGTPQTVHQLAFDTFHVGDVITKMQHSTKFALVDQKGFIRSYYSSLSPEGIPFLLRDAEALRKDK